MIKQTLRVPLHIIYIIYLCSRLYERRTRHTTLTLHTHARARAHTQHTRTHTQTGRQAGRERERDADAHVRRECVKRYVTQK